MSTKSVACLGGGPAGLFFARLVRLMDPSWDVTVYERNPADATIGFGIGLGDRTMANLAEVDPGTHHRLAAAGVPGHGMELRHRGTTIRWGEQGGTAIARQALLTTLREQAADAGARIVFDRRMRLAEVGSATVVVGADGVHSGTRGALADRFDVREGSGSAMYIWLGANLDLDAMTFSFVENEHGSWAAHAYPYAPGLATFLVETDERSWRNAGLDGFDASAAAPGASDEVSRRYLERVFAADLGGERLQANNSRWARFRNIRCGRWSAGNVVLIGDAAHTAHFSVGSGTTLAMDDAITLATELTSQPRPESAFQRYEERRRPIVERLQMRAEASQLWWETMSRRLDRDAADLAFDYLTRTGALSFDRVRAAFPDFARTVRAGFDDAVAAATGAGGRADDPLCSPVRVRDDVLPSRLVVTKPPLQVGPDRDRDAKLTLFGGLALCGAAAVIADLTGAEFDADSWRDINQRVSALTPAMLGVRIAADDQPAHAKAVEAEFRLVEFDLSASSTDLNSLRRLTDAIRVLRKDSASLRLVAVDLGWPQTTPYRTGAEALVDGLEHLAGAGLDIVRLQPAGPDATARLATVQLAEQVRRATGLRVLVGGPAFTAEQLRTEVVASRIDLAESWPAPLPSPAPLRHRPSTGTDPLD
ncbi:oxidoreductase [Actinomadura sp. KC216]|uniref:FAD-dependent monooxygenase n=1 Tax=Actinomadura sp. KC216 TaxID=2530370 RepID=UPI00104FFDF3|nr:FAD-dependent monooxygenase [Actinomadura sp. KC216]TDB83796.1 oxidoreductase [Actinomadura sp. KC216]